MIPHIVNGTHTIIIMNYKENAFCKSAKNLILTIKFILIMTKKVNSKDATMFVNSKVNELFNLVKTENGIVICCGKFKVSSKYFKTYKQADDYIASKPYEILINVSVLMVKLNNYEEETKTTKQKNSENK